MTEKSFFAIIKDKMNNKSFIKKCKRRNRFLNISNKFIEKHKKNLSINITFLLFTYIEGCIKIEL